MLQTEPPEGSWALQVDPSGAEALVKVGNYFPSDAHAYVCVRRAWAKTADPKYLLGKDTNYPGDEVLLAAMEQAFPKGGNVLFHPAMDLFMQGVKTGSVVQVHPDKLLVVQPGNTSLKPVKMSFEDAMDLFLWV